jgi:hypothetical protein
LPPTANVQSQGPALSSPFIGQNKKFKIGIFCFSTISKEDRTGKISLRDIQSKMGKSISPVGLGRLMVKLYLEVKSKQERLISEWNKRESVFHGVKWRVEDNACSFEFLDILKYTETCFLIHKTHEEITQDQQVICFFPFWTGCHEMIIFLFCPL